MTSRETIATIWGEVLAVDNVQPTDSFFELGGDSLTITIMAFRLEQALDVIVNVDLVFDHPTLEAFSTALLDS